MRLVSLSIWRGTQLDTTLVVAAVGIVALAIGLAIGLGSPSVGLLVGGTLVLGILLALRQDQLTAAVVIAVSLLQDWYRLITLPVTFPVVSIIVALALIAIVFFGQSAEHPWVRVPTLWGWLLLLVVAAPHILQGVGRNESIKYYAQVYVNGLAMWMLGVQIVRDAAQLRRLLVLLTAFGTLIAIHSILISLTGTFLLATPTQLAYLASVSGFRISGTTEVRAGSFLGSPDWNGALMALLVFLPVCLFFDTAARWAKVVFGVQFALIMLALFFTYSTAAWVAVAVGMAVFLALIRQLSGSRRARLYLLAAIIAVPLLLAFIFPQQYLVLIGHFTASGQLSLRVGAWTTALRVIRAYPLQGVGLGWTTYLERAAPFRVPAQTIPLGHPHNAYLEIGAMAGLPVLVVFLVILASAFRQAFCTCRTAEGPQRVLIGGAIAALVALTFNSLAINGWTLQPLAAIGWLLAGALASPALRAAVAQPRRSEKPTVQGPWQTTVVTPQENGSVG